MNKKIQVLLEKYNSDKTRLMDMLWDVQNQQGYISEEAVTSLAEGLNMSPLDIRETLSFYHFFKDRPFGQHKIYLCNTVIAKMGNYEEVRATLEQETNTSFGNVDDSGTFGLGDANCIGLSDQEPAMMVDHVVFTKLTAEKVINVISQLKQGKTAVEIANPEGADSKYSAYINAMVAENIRTESKVMFKAGRDYKAIQKACLDKHPEQVIMTITESNLKGRGGAGFPTGLKWKMGHDAEGAEKYVICNADEGEPGTFKDRVLLSHSPKDVLLGMIAAAYAIGSRHGILYLRAEYWYLKDYLQQQIQDFRDEGLLGKQILGTAFEFDIRIQMGAGAYVCGDETALIESCEGKRGTPRVKPPYPIQQGYLGMPTSVNNVETLAIASRIVEEGSAWFSAMGTDESTGTRLLSVSGDCDKPGIYEIEWGTTLNEVLSMIGAVNAKYVQISGPAGDSLSVSKDGERKFCYSDLSCNGSLMVFDNTRDILGIVRDYTEFFVEESCGICVPCRAGGVDLQHKMERIIDGRGCQQDLDEIIQWSKLLKGTSRCGLGTAAPNPILATLDKFPEIYQEKLIEQKGPLLPSFNMEEAMSAHDLAYKHLVQEDAE
ncbi:MAG: NAD(P)H-dependent oxidoreductase subunit E [Methylococcaceae bacterium]|nr:NAD(P)H-dependent oxidoreductase subunit E [Methylococcaceae bacterium]